MLLPITTMLAAVLALMMVWLSFATIAQRVKTDTSIGEGTSPELFKAIRAHGNLIENAPIAVIVIGLLEFQNAPTLLVQILAGAFIVARLMHPIGIRMDKAPNAPRIIGTMGTQLVLIVGAVYALYMVLL